MPKFFEKSKKNLILGHFGPFLPKFGQTWIFLETIALSVFRYSNYLWLCQKSAKAFEQFPRKTPNWRTDRHRDDSDFIRLSVGKFFWITCLVHKIVQNLNSPAPPPLPPLVWKCMHLRTPSNMRISFYHILYFYQNLAQRCQKYSRMLLLFSLFYCKYIQKLNLNLQKIWRHNWASKLNSRLNWCHQVQGFL